MWPLLTFILAVGLAVALVRYLLLKRELGRLADEMASIHKERTNRRLTVGSQQPQLGQLAVAVNTLYDDMDAERAAGRAAMDGMRQSMADISHDLRTPLTSIMGYLKLLRGGGNTPQQADSYLDVTYQKADALNRLVSGLFEMARLESGGYTFRHERLDAAALLAEELAGAYTQLEAMGIQPKVTLPDGPLWLVGDRDALARVFANLLQNMLRHGAAPMRIQGGTEDGMVVFRFANAALALPPEDVDMLFRRFFTADRMRSGKDTGLGLAITKEFVEQMSGEIIAEWQEGTLMFTLRFPG